MGKKYIIELNPDCVEGEYLRIPARIAGKEQWLVTKAALTPYTELDLDHVRKEAYEEGFYVGRTLNTGKYEKGLNDAWEAARKIVLDTIPPDALIKMFGNDPYSLIGKIFEVYSASEVTARIKAWEKEQKEQKEIKVGDEVATDAGNRASVLYENPDGTQVFVFKSDGTAAWWTKSTLHRTGRNFPEIAAVLEKMRGEQE